MYFTGRCYSSCLAMADDQEVQTDSADSSYERALSLMKKELPEYVVNIFMACGYDRLESIAKMDDNTIDEMIAYTNSTFDGDCLR